MALQTSHKAGIAGTAGVVLALVAFTPTWEGMDPVAKRDMIGTGHPITYCYGQTAEFGVIKVGTRFTKKECDEKLAASLPKYIEPVGRCVKVAVPVKTMAALVDGAWNAGPARVCASPMVRLINAGRPIKQACDAFDGWIVTSDHKVRTGLIDRRSGELHGDHRKSERALCLEGLSEPKADWYLHASHAAAPAEEKSFCSGSGQGADCPRNDRVAPDPAPVAVPPKKHWWSRFLK